MLNPMYNHLIDAAFECILRAGFVIINHGFKKLEEEKAKELFAGKFSDVALGTDGARLIDRLAS